MENFRELAKRTKYASIKLGGLTEEVKNLVLHKVADKLEINKQEIFDANKKEGVYVRYPEREELNAEINESLIVEFYNR